jgi:hypothetical protein
MKKSEVLVIISKLPVTFQEKCHFEEHPSLPGLTFLNGHYWYFPYRLIRSIDIREAEVQFRVQDGLFTFYFHNGSPHAMFLS